MIKDEFEWLARPPFDFRLEDARAEEPKRHFTLHYASERRGHVWVYAEPQMRYFAVFLAPPDRPSFDAALDLGGFMLLRGQRPPDSRIPDGREEATRVVREHAEALRAGAARELEGDWSAYRQVGELLRAAAGRARRVSAFPQ